MRIGLLSDLHAGYMRGTRENAQGVNVREQDILDAASAAVGNLVIAGVEAIVDLGDLFHVPAPKKRALVHMINTINWSGLPWYSANGNHTLQRTKSDLHVYDVLSEFCPKFHGYVEPTFVKEVGAYLIPYGTEAEALKKIPKKAEFIGGHFACDDVPWPGEHVAVADLPSIPTFLGHYHTRKITFKDNKPPTIMYGPFYIGATERFAWGEATNPTGAAVFDTEDKGFSFIDHPTREWMDVTSDAKRLTDDLGGRDFEGKIVRINVDATPSEYHNLDIRAVRELARSALELQVRRVGTTEAFTADHADTQTYSLLEAWQAHTKSVKPVEMRKSVRERGARALSEAGVGE